MSAYIKRKSDGMILFSSNTQTVANPNHLVSLKNFVTSRSLSLSDFIISDGTETEISQMVKDAETSAEKAMAEIHRLEATVTQRRIRAMTTDAGKKWMEDLEAKIAIERGKL